MSEPTELGAPPSEGLVVRNEERGFYLRLQPTPTPNVRIVAGLVVGLGALGTGLGMITSSVVEVQLWVVFGSIAFGLLLYGISFGQGFFPLELRGDERVLDWGGERFAWTQIGACVADGDRLELRSVQGTVLASARNLSPDAAAWTAKVIEASKEA